MKINGVLIAKTILSNLKKRVSLLKEKKVTPHLAVILVGSDPSSVSYVTQKEIKGETIGVKISVINASQNIGETNLLSRIEQLNNDDNVHGFIVQRPLPQNIDSKQVALAINPEKDIDGFHPDTKFKPPIALAVLKIFEGIYDKKSEARNPKSEINSNNQNTKFQNKFLSFEHSNFDIVSSFDIRYSNYIKWLKSKKIAIVGKGETGGRPIIETFRKMGIEPKVIDSKTPNPENLTKKADIIISAVGKANVIGINMIKRGVVLISVGLHKGEDGKLHGDYDEEEIKNVASFYTPTPGGVGPVNVAMLLQNLVKSAEISIS